MLRSIAAIDEARGLANNSGIPWIGKIPSDAKYFRSQITGGIILMGAGTYAEFAEPLHGRTNYVVTHATAPLRHGFEAVNDLNAFLQIHKDETIQDIGGASLYAQTITYADELILTQLEGTYGCTKFFPEYAGDFVRVEAKEPITENGITFHYETWRRKTPRN